MTKEEYDNLLKEIVPDWKYPIIFKDRNDAINFYYTNHRLNTYVQNIKTHKVIKLSNTVYVNEFTVKEIKEYRNVTLYMYKKFEEQKKIEDIAKDF